jgi:hypothetical protein
MGAGTETIGMAESPAALTSLTILSLPDTFAIAQLPAGAVIPDWAASGPFVSITHTPDQLSIVCRDSHVPTDVKADRRWRALRIAGTLDFALVGILASVVVPLANAGVAVFAISTFDTDYLLVKGRDFERAAAVLERAGHVVVPGPPMDEGG